MPTNSPTTSNQTRDAGLAEGSAPASAAPPTAPTHKRYAGLDGLRAVAVGLVVVYHLFPQSWIRGGFIGVDVFFVISGFLITSLLLREHTSTGGIRLVNFWRRRARRLLPALATVVTVCATAAWVIGGDVLVRLGEQVLGAATFSYNWVSTAGGTGYFSAATPELFRNLWSLAVEEQFYVLWPLVLPLFLLLPRRWARALAALLLAAASAVWMGTLVASGGDLTRAYFGTDTHAFGILLGVALAFVLERLLAAPSPAPFFTRRAVRAAGLVLGIGAVAGLVVLASVAPTDSAATFPGAVLTASVLSAIAMVAGVVPGSLFGRAIDTQPLRWIGDRSYGIYLWHWPLLVLLVAAVQKTGPDAGVPTTLGITALVLTLVLSEASYRLIETPVRRHGFRGSLRRLGAGIAGSPAARVRAVAGLTAGVVLVGGTTAAIAAAPDVTSSQSVVAAGAEALAAAKRAAAAGEVPGVGAGLVPGAGAGSGSGAGAVPGAGAGSVPDAAVDRTAGTRGTAPGAGAPGSAHGQDAASARVVPSPSPTPVTGPEISAVGDSVMLASAPGLLERLPGIQVDAAESRSSWAGPGILQSLADSGQLRPYVVIALGTNGPVDLDSLERMVQIAGPDRHVVLVNAFAPRDWIAGVNADLAAFAASHPSVVIADWSGAIAGRTDLLAGDNIHPGDAGGRVFADTVVAAVTRVEEQRAWREYAEEQQRERRLQHGRVMAYE